MKYWMGTVSKEHVMIGVEGNFCQLCHGKSTPLKRMKKGDILIYYSPKISLNSDVKFQEITAIGKIKDENVKKMIVTKALEFLQKEIKEDRKIGKEIEKQQLLRQAKLYRELDKNNEIDALFAKADKKFWKSISLFYMDEPEMALGNVYNEKRISTVKDLQQALVYADKILSDFKGNKAERTEILLIKAEAYRRLGEFSEAEKLLKEIDSEKIDKMYEFQFENIRRQVKSKDKRVYQYLPPHIMY